MNTNKKVGERRQTVSIEFEPFPAAALHYGSLLTCRVAFVLRSENEYLEKHFLIHLDEPYALNRHQSGTAIYDKLLTTTIQLGGKTLTTGGFMMAFNDGEKEKKERYRNFVEPSSEFLPEGCSLQLKLIINKDKKSKQYDLMSKKQ